MKKLLSLLLVAITLLSTGLSIFASDTADVVITAPEVSAQPGEYVEVPIVIEKNNGFCGLNIYFTYPEGVTFDSISNSVGELTCTSDVTVVWDGANDYTGTGELAVLKVLISPDAEPGDNYTVKINFIEAYDLNLNDVSVSVSEVVINVTKEDEVLSNPFTDVKDGQWYTDGILWCYHNEYMAGVSDTDFGRKSNVTRAMFATILAKIDGSDISGYSKMSFTDVKPNQWYSNAIEWAYQNGYAAGLAEGYFGRKDNVSREQIALFFYTYSSKNGIDVSEKANLSAYTDLGRVHSWALNAVEWAVAKGLISGKSDTTLAPRDSATRAEIALIIKNYVENVKN